MSITCSESLTRLEEAFDEFCAQLGDDRGIAERAERLIRLDVLNNRLASVRATEAAGFDASGGPLADGMPTTGAWLAAYTTSAPGESRDLVRVGRALRDRLPNTDAALAAGEIGWTAARTIEKGLRTVEDPAVLGEADAVLAAQARILTQDHLWQACRRTLQWLDPQTAQKDSALRYQDRCLSLAPLLDGAVAVSGQLDEESAGILMSALSPLMRPLGPEDVRSAPQRRHDALIEIIAKGARDGHAGTANSSGLPPTLLVRVDVERLAGLDLPGGRGACAEPNAPRADASDCGDRGDHIVRAPRPRCADERGACRGGVAGEGADSRANAAYEAGGSRAGAAVAELDWGGPILRETLQRIGCGAQMIRLVTAGQSRVLDVGRASRLATPAQRIALAARDQGCRFPGCDRPPGWVDAHHIEEWLRGGKTDLEDLISLCRFHHRLVHEGGWTLRRSGHLAEFLDRNGAVRGSTPLPTADDVG